MNPCTCPNCGTIFQPGVDPEWIERVVAARKKIGMKQNELAAKLGYSPQYINDIERQKRLTPNSVMRAEWERIVGLEC